MSRTAQIYVAAVSVLGLLLLLAAAAWPALGGGFPDLGTAAAYLVPALVLSVLKLRLPGLEGSYSFNFLVLLAALHRLSLAEVLTAGALCALVQMSLNVQRRPRPVQFAFNTANYVLSLGAAYAAVRFGLLPAGAPLPLALAGAASAYFLVNTLLVSGVLALIEKKPLGEVASAWYEGPFLYYLLGTQLVGLLPLSDWAPAAESWLLFLPAACLLHFTRGLAVRDRAANSPGRLVVNDPEQLPQSVRFFVNLVAAAASLVLVAGLAVWQCDSMIRFAGFAALTLFCSAWKIPLPGLHGTVSLGFVPIIAAMAQLSLGETLLLSLGSALVQLFWRPKERPRPVQVVFSASAVLLSNAAAFVVCRNFGAFGLDQSLVTFFAAACLVQYLTNTFLVSRVLAWLHARPVVGLWREFYFWSMPYYLACAAAGALIASLAREVGWSLPFLVLPLMAMVTVSYRCHLRRAT